MLAIYDSKRVNELAITRKTNDPDKAKMRVKSPKNSIELFGVLYLL